MSKLRFDAIRESMNRMPVQVEHGAIRRSEIFADHVFDTYTMQQVLTKEAYQSVVAAVDKGKKIDRSIADQIALAMKEWAMLKGVTHYTHWFQPLTGATAEKHDAFFETTGDGRDNCR